MERDLALPGARGAEPVHLHHRLGPAPLISGDRDHFGGAEPADDWAAASEGAAKPGYVSVRRVHPDPGSFTIIGTIVSDILLAISDPRIRYR